jgi:endoglucanase
MGWGAALLSTAVLAAPGCVMPGQTPAIGDAAEMLGSCGPEGLIDDFEDNNNQAKVEGGRGGYWYTFADEAGTQVEPEAGGPFAPAPGGANGSKYAAHLKGRIGSGSVVFGALGLNLTDPKGPYDASKYKGISFWAKKASGSYGQVRFKVPDVSTDKEGGVCSECFNDFGAELNLTEAWQHFVLPFRKLRQMPDWGTPRPHMIKAHKLYGMQWQVNKPGANVDFWVDDVEFLCE